MERTSGAFDLVFGRGLRRLLATALLVANGFAVLFWTQYDRFDEPVTSANGAADGSGPPHSVTQAAANGQCAVPGLAASAKASIAWEVIDRETVNPNRIPALPEGAEEAVLVAIAAEMRNWDVGRRVALPVPQTSHTYSSLIDRVDGGSGVIRTYTGRLVDGDLPRPFVITVGDRNTFAYVGTPTGSYELVGNREYAWLMPTADLVRHVDYTKPDYGFAAESDIHRARVRR